MIIVPRTDVRNRETGMIVIITVRAMGTMIIAMGTMIIVPYGIIVFNNNYPMDMVGHNDEFIQLTMGKMGWDFLPTFFCHFAKMIQYHFPIQNFSE
jgi:hypothetical protein